MVRYRNCAVWGCEDKTSHRHRFPNPTKYPGLFQQWVKTCCNPRLNELDANHIYNSYRVCHAHFIPEDISSNMYLKKGIVVPTRHLPLSPEAVKLPRELPSNSDVGETLPIGADMDTPNIEGLEQERTDGSLSPRLDQSLISTSVATSIQLHEEAVAEDEDDAVTKKRGADFILKDVGVTRANDLTPKAKRLYCRVTRLQRSTKQLKKRQLLSVKAHKAEEILRESLMSLSPTVKNFVRTQIRLSGKSPKGRRYNLDDKILGLVLQKQSGKGYRTMSKVFALPSKKTLTTLLSRIPIDCGINEPIFDNLKANVSQLHQRDRACIVLFDEVSIEPHIDVNKTTKDFDGFVHTGLHKTNIIADHALVFMIKGISKNWRQPLMYTFCKGATNASSVAAHLTNVIKECQKAGLRVIVSVSDQGQPNVSAINKLVNSNGQENSSYLKEYTINGEKVIHIYDPPHLLKGIRNNLLTKDLVWEKDGQTLRAKWEHIIYAYEKDNSSADLRSMPRLTDNHVYKEKLKKMKVSYAAKVFSHSVAACLRLLSENASSAVGTVKPDGLMDTAKVLKFFDGLFDSVNASTLKDKKGKKFKCGASLNSGHIEYWKEARKSLSKMYFESNGRKEVPPSLKNWMSSLAGFEALVESLAVHDLRFLITRRVNQDPLENFFCQLRQHAGRNINPTPIQFKHYFKTLLLNSFTSSHSVSANCELDNTEESEGSSIMLTSVRQFVTQGIPEEDDFDNSIKFETLNLPDKCTYDYLTKVSLGYVSGFIAKKLNFDNCVSCKNSIIAKSPIKEWHDLTLEKEYTRNVPNKLKYCTPPFLKLLCQLYSIIIHVLPRMCERPNCIFQLMEYLQKNSEFTPLCNHDIKKQIVVKFTYLCCYNWANAINKYLCGSESRKISPQDVIQIQALEYHKKRCRHKAV